MASQCGYGVDVVPSGTPFEPPATLIDQAGEAPPSSSSSSSNSDDAQLAISTVDLQRYLIDGEELRRTAHRLGPPVSA